MKCSEFEREIDLFNKGTVLSIEAQKHASLCPRCSLLLQHEKLLLSAIDQERQVTVSPFLSTRVMAHLERTESGFGFKYIRYKFLQVAVILFAILGGFIGSGLMDRNSRLEDFDIILTDYFNIDHDGYGIEDSWLYYDIYEK